MSAIQITNIVCKKNQASFNEPIELEIYFQVFKEIKNGQHISSDFDYKFSLEIDWQLVYIGCANNQKYDQVLEQFSMGPFTKAGQMQFNIQVQKLQNLSVCIQAEAPDYKKIPSKDDLLGVTAIILSANYKKQEFFRCGFYVYNCYDDQELVEIDTPEAPIQIDKVQRNILLDKPRITRFEIQWDESQQESTQESAKQQDSKQSNQNSISQVKKMSPQDQQEFKPFQDYLQKEYVQQAIFENSNGFDKENNVLQYNSIANQF